jgi:CheY-like chemotaxis protein
MAHILLADDEPATRETVKRALASDGHIIVVTEDGQEALDQIAAGARFDLVISDVQMPVLDGFSLAEKVFALRPGLPVVLMSAHADGFAKAEALKPKLAAVVSKPFTLDQIRQVVKAALG